jgi:hypothetical protein
LINVKFNYTILCEYNITHSMDSSGAQKPISYSDLLAIIKEIVQLRTRLTTKPSDQDIKDYKLLVKGFEAYTRIREHPDITIDTINNMNSKTEVVKLPEGDQRPPPQNPSSQNPQNSEGANGILYLFGDKNVGDKTGNKNDTECISEASEIDSDMDPDELFEDGEEPEKLPDQKDVELMLKKSALQLNRALSNKNYVVTEESDGFDDEQNTDKAAFTKQQEEQPGLGGHKGNHSNDDSKSDLKGDSNCKNDHKDDRKGDSDSKNDHKDDHKGDGDSRDDSKSDNKGDKVANRGDQGGDSGSNLANPKSNNNNKMSSLQDESESDHFGLSNLDKSNNISGKLAEIYSDDDDMYQQYDHDIYGSLNTSHFKSGYESDIGSECEGEIEGVQRTVNQN